MPFFRGETGFSFKSKERKAKEKHKKKQNKQKEQKNKEGLGPSEVALWATSLDP